MYPRNTELNKDMQTDGLTLCTLVSAAEITFAEVVAADTNDIHAAITCSTAATVVTTGFNRPDFARNITATAGGTAGDIKAVQVIVEGLNLAGEVITETLPVFTVDTAGTVAGAKAFMEVTKVTIPAMDGAGATVSIGFGEILGLPFKLRKNTHLMSFVDNVKEATAPTVTVSLSAIESNTIDFNTALSGKTVETIFAV